MAELIDPGNAPAANGGEALHRLERTMADLARKNEELDRALEIAQIATRAKTAFLANMSHEFRTPLNAIIGFADVLRSEAFGVDPSRYVEYSGYILQAGQHLLNLINDVLDLSQIETQTLKVDLRPVNLYGVTNQAISLMTARARDKRIALELCDLDPTVNALADPTRLLQVVLNLLTNAVKFTPHDGRVAVELLVGAATADLVIADSGPGIAAEKHALIFEAFTQAHETAFTRPHDGAGLGLSIARRLARLMMGDVIVDSAPGQGSRFTIRLNRAPNEPPAAPLRTNGQTAAAPCA